MILAMLTRCAPMRKPIYSYVNGISSRYSLKYNIIKARRKRIPPDA
jgi:hypothetical protein